MAELAKDSILKDAVRSGQYIFSIAVVFSFVYNLLRLTGPLFMLLVYDRVISSRSEETLVVLFMIMVALLTVMGLVDYSRRRLLARLGAQFQERIEGFIFDSASKNDYFNTLQSKPTIGLSELDGLRGFFHSNAIVALLDFVWAPMFLIVVFTFHWVLGWVVVAGLVLLLLLSVVKRSFAKGRSDSAKAASKKIDELKKILITSREVLKSQGMASSFKERWINARKVSRDKSIELKDWSAWFSILSRQIRMLLQYSVLAVGAYLMLQGKLSVGAMIASMFLSVRVFIPVEQFIKELPAMGKALENWKDLKDILASKEIRPDNEELWSLEPSLIINNLSAKSATTGKQIFRSLNLEIDPGSIIVINGASGSGKTVFAETILGAFPKSGGTILCGEANVDRLSPLQAKNIFAYIPERVQLIDGTVEENIASMALQSDIKKVIAAAKLAQIHDLILSLPNGYKTKVEATRNDFSKGQRHQIVLARALYEEPSILIIDEPDLFLQKVLVDGLKKSLCDPKCIIIVFSRDVIPSLHLDRCFTLENGRIRENKVTERVTHLKNSKVEKKIATLVTD